MDKKPRSDSKLDAMPGNRVMELRDKLLGGDSYLECITWLDMECGVTTSVASLSVFYKRHCWPVVRERRQVSVIKAEALGDAMSQDPVNWDSAIVDRTKQKLFEFLAGDGASLEDAAEALKAITAARKQDFTEVIQTKRQETEERKLALLEQKAKQADDSKDVLGNEKLTPEQKQERLKGIYGMG